MTSVCVFDRILSKTASPLNHHVQRDTNITANFLARKRPCPPPQVAEGKKHKQPSTVLMKLLMYHWYVFGRCTLEGLSGGPHLQPMDTLENGGMEWLFVANPRPTHRSQEMCHRMHPSTPKTQSILQVSPGSPEPTAVCPWAALWLPV